MITDIIEYAIKKDASDIHITDGKKVAMRMNGDIVVIDKFGTISRDMIVQFLEISSPDRLGAFLIPNNPENMKVIDFSFTDEDNKKRVRGQAYRGLSGLSLALRILYGKIPSITELNLPVSIEKFIHMREGLVIFTGATGSGKSTTLASIVDNINRTRPVNILTIEDPIEYVHKDKMARIHQREVGRHVRSFADATVEALREDPDVILVGEMRDLVTIENALMMAETGHLVFGTLHSMSVADTIDRIVNVFPENKQMQIRFSLSNILKGVVSQRLVKTSKSESRIPLTEVMMLNNTITQYIRKSENKNNYRQTIRSSKNEGSVHLVDNVHDHIKKNRMTVEEAEKYLDEDDIELLKSVMKIR